jgi:zinc protease
MKRVAVILFLVSVALGAMAQGAPVPTRPEALPKVAPVTYAPPAFQRETLPNGMRLILLPDHRLPLVKLYAVVKAGSVYEPADKLGLAELTGTSLKAGGTKAYPADRMLETLESLAAELDTAIGAETGQVSLNLLSKDLDAGLPIFAEVLMHPAFDPAKVAVEKAKMEEEIRRQNEDPWEVGDREFSKALYGAESPWARTATVKGVEALTPADLAAFHALYFKPSSVILAAAGDFDPQLLKGRLSDLFRGWPGGAVDYSAVAPAPAEDKGGVVLVNREDLTQATVFVGELSGKRFTETGFNGDRYAMDVTNFILGGGGFTSTLTREIRSNRGLAYTAGSDYAFGTDRGIFLAYAQTGVDTAAQVCGLVRDACAEAAQKAPAAADLELAKSSIINKFVFSFQNPGQIVAQAALQEINGYPEDFTATYTDKIRAVTGEDCLRVARKYIQPPKFTYLVYGPAAKLEAGMKAYGTPKIQALPEP